MQVVDFGGWHCRDVGPICLEKLEATPRGTASLSRNQLSRWWLILASSASGVSNYPLTDYEMGLHDEICAMRAGRDAPTGASEGQSWLILAYTEDETARCGRSTHSVRSHTCCVCRACRGSIGGGVGTTIATRVRVSRGRGSTAARGMQSVSVCFCRVCFCSAWGLAGAVAWARGQARELSVC